MLVHYDPHLGYYDLMPDEAERNAFLRDVCSHDWNQEQDRGRGWEEAEAEAIGRHPDKADLIRAFRKNWHLMVSHEYPESVAILRALVAKGHDVTLLTNFAADTFREAQQTLSVPGGEPRRHGFRRGAADQARPGDLRASHEGRSASRRRRRCSSTTRRRMSKPRADFGWKAELFHSAETDARRSRALRRTEV